MITHSRSWIHAFVTAWMDDDGWQQTVDNTHARAGAHRKTRNTSTCVPEQKQATPKPLKNSIARISVNPISEKNVSTSPAAPPSNPLNYHYFPILLLVGWLLCVRYHWLVWLLCAVGSGAAQGMRGRCVFYCIIYCRQKFSFTLSLSLSFSRNDERPPFRIPVSLVDCFHGHNYY